jgi:hypothetical protein
MLQQADAIALLFGWRLSRGARYELLTAQLLGLVVYNADTMAQFDAPKIGTGFSGVLIA